MESADRIPSAAKARVVLRICGTAEEAAEKVALVTSGAKARVDKKALIAALKRCATQEPEFSGAR